MSRKPPYKTETSVFRQHIDDSDRSAAPLYPLLLVNREADVGPELSDMLQRTHDGLKNGQEPELPDPPGQGGTYILLDQSGQSVSVFKPVDEEPKAKNNPWRGRGRGRGYSDSSNGLREGIKVERGGPREVVAFFLDHPETGKRKGYSTLSEGFAGVPPTISVFCLHRKFNYPPERYENGYGYEEKCYKYGSLQKFEKNSGTCRDVFCNNECWSSSKEMYGPKVPVKEVHKISVLDIRLANTDRHLGNILFRKGENGDSSKNKLIPIDHGYCLPENFASCDFKWRGWWQAKEPYSEDIVKYIRKLDVEEDLILLKNLGFKVSPQAARTLRISTMLLQRAVEEGLTPFDIGNIMCRFAEAGKSIIEKIVDNAVDIVLSREEREEELIEEIPKYMESAINKYKTKTGLLASDSEDNQGEDWDDWMGSEREE